jgi:ABC-type antimicrobial peptide transport system permease subunit
MLYYPLAQIGSLSASLLVRAAGDPTALARDVRAAVHAVDPRQPIADVRSFDEVRAGSLASPRTTALLLGLFAMLALVVTAAGIGGVIALTVSQRTREIAVRMALGAKRADVVTMVLRQGLGLVLAGLVLGAGVALALGRLMSTLLFDIAPTDPVTFVSVAVLVIVVAALACFAPARRAAGIDPMVMLRA